MYELQTAIINIGVAVSMGLVNYVALTVSGELASKRIKKITSERSCGTCLHLCSVDGLLVCAHQRNGQTVRVTPNSLCPSYYPWQVLTEKEILTKHFEKMFNQVNESDVVRTNG